MQKYWISEKDKDRFSIFEGEKEGEKKERKREWNGSWQKSCFRRA